MQPPEQPVVFVPVTMLASVVISSSTSRWRVFGNSSDFLTFSVLGPLPLSGAIPDPCSITTKLSHGLTAKQVGRRLRCLLCDLNDVFQPFACVRPDRA
jgi:hypothetical protein